MPWICEDGRAHLRAYLVVRELTIGDVGERAERFAGANESRKSGQSSALVSKPLSLIKEVFERDLHRLPQLEDQLCRAYSTCCGTPTHCTSILQSTLLDLTTANTRYFPNLYLVNYIDVGLRDYSSLRVTKEMAQSGSKRSETSISREDVDECNLMLIHTKDQYGNTPRPLHSFRKICACS